MVNGVRLRTFPPGSGYGDAGELYARGLRALGVPVGWSPVDWGDGSRGWDLPAAPAVAVLMAPIEWWPRWRAAEPDGRPVVFTTWESDRLPDAWVAALNGYDLVLVPSTLNRDVFVASGVRARVEVVPHGARAVEPRPGATFGAVGEDDYVFYTIATWETRKRLDALLRAYLDAFDASDPVALVVKTSANDQEAGEAIRRGLMPGTPVPHGLVWWTVSGIVSRYARPAKVHLIAEHVPRRAIDALHTRGDCFVSLSRGEGWSLGPFEAALFGNPSIVTGWGGHLDFLGDDYPLLVDWELERRSLRTPGGDAIWESLEERWARADPRHASERLRWAFEHRAEARAIGAALGESVRERFAAERVCRRLASVLGLELPACGRAGPR